MPPTTTNAIVIKQTGGPEVLTWDQVELPPVNAGQVLIRHTAVGFNMVDTYIRKGLYPADLPMIPGSEAAGIVESAAADVAGFKTGDRVVYLAPAAGPGTYSEQRVIDARHLIKIPDDISDETAAASLLKGLTVWALLCRTYPVKEGDSILVYAAAGGVGSIMCQWAKHTGATVIGIVGSDSKMKIAAENGCDKIINRNRQDIVETVRKLTDGRGVPVVYDSLGKDTFEQSLDCLRPTGLMVSYGNATGPVPPVNILTLMQKGSLFLTRPRFSHYIQGPEDLQQATGELFHLIQSGVVKIHIGQRFPLQDADKAHIAAESTQTVGSTILTV